MAEKVTTIMALKVDLQCHRCYKKVKKILSKFPQIRDQVYDEKQNTVVIKVVCCSPEKIKEKIRCKGGDSIKSIEIVPPPPPPKPKPNPPKPAEPEKPPPPPAEKPKPAEKPPEPAPKPPPAEKPKPAEKPPEPAPKPPPAEKPKAAEKPPEPAPKPPPPVVPAYPPPFFPIGVCCGSCYEGLSGGPCFHGHGGPPPSYEGYGRPVYDSYGGGGGYRGYPSRCDYFSEENPSGCTIM